MKKRIEEASGAAKERPQPKRYGILSNLPGIAAALAIAFGAVMLVQRQLISERLELLEGGGAVALPAQNLQTDAEKLEEAESAEEGAGREMTREELMRALEFLESPGEIYPHEPRPGQLSMDRAVQCAREWMRDFLLPQLGIAADDGGEGTEYRAACFLWTREESGGDTEDPLLSYWTVSLLGQEIGGMLVLNAATGQVMDAVIDCTAPVEYQEDSDMTRILEEYMDSFAMGKEDYSRLTETGGYGRKLSRGYGEDEISVSISISTVAIAYAGYWGTWDSGEQKDMESGGPREYTCIQLGLEVPESTIYVVPKDQQGRVWSREAANKAL